MTDRRPALPAVAAYAAGVQVATLRQWARRGHITPADNHGCYDLVEVVEYAAARDDSNYGRAVAARSRRGETRRDPPSLRAS